VSFDRLPIPEDEMGFAEISVYKLIEALDRVLKALEPKLLHEVVRDRISISDAIHAIADRLRAGGPLTFFALFEGARTRQAVIATFLAMLEMARLRLIRMHQEHGSDEIIVSPKGEALSAVGTSPEVAKSEVDGEYK
jgi:segregation and condensation protein A